MTDSLVRMYGHFFWEYWEGWEKHCDIFMTTPVAYIAKVPGDPFPWIEGNPNSFHRKSSFVYCNFAGAYKDKDKPLGLGDTSSGLYFHPTLQPLTAIRITAADGPVKNVAWTVSSPGPGTQLTSLLGMGAPGASYPNLSLGVIQVYDPTNGTSSKGGIVSTSAGFLGD